MLDIELISELEIGIWKIEDEGIRCKLGNQLWRFIPNEEVMSTIIIPSQKVAWSWPIHFGGKTWSSPNDIENLIIALALKRLQLGIETNDQMDADTWEEVLRIIEEKRNCNLDELDLSLAELPF